MTPFRFFHLKSIGGQIAALVVASLVALHLILTVSFLISRPDRADPPPDSAHQLADAALLLNGAGDSERPRILADIARAFPQAGIELLAPGTASVADDNDGQQVHFVRRHLGHQYKVLALAPQGGVRRIAIQLPDGTMIAGRVEQLPYPPRFWGGPWIMRSEEHTSELQSRGHIVCRLLLEKKKKSHQPTAHHIDGIVHDSKDVLPQSR